MAVSKEDYDALKEEFNSLVVKVAKLEDEADKATEITDELFVRIHADWDQMKKDYDLHDFMPKVNMLEGAIESISDRLTNMGMKNIESIDQINAESAEINKLVLIDKQNIDNHHHRINDIEENKIKEL